MTQREFLDGLDATALRGLTLTVLFRRAEYSFYVKA